MTLPISSRTPVIRPYFTYFVYREGRTIARGSGRQDKSLEDDLRDYVAANGYHQPQAELDDGGWSLASQDVQKVLDKLGKVGVPLEEYVDGKVYRGILTGFNEAFVIDENAKDKLIAEDPKSAELIKPFLAGKDIKRYLNSYREQLEPKPKDWSGKGWKGRKSGSYEWFEIQDTVAYYRELEKPKLVYVMRLAQQKMDVS